MPSRSEGYPLAPPTGSTWRTHSLGGSHWGLYGALVVDELAVVRSVKGRSQRGVEVNRIVRVVPLKGHGDARERLGKPPGVDLDSGPAVRARHVRVVVTRRERLNRRKAHATAEQVELDEVGTAPKDSFALFHVLSTSVATPPLVAWGK